MKQSERTPVQYLYDLAPGSPLGPTMKEARGRCRVVRVGDDGWPTWDDIHRNVVERHYLHAWSAHTLMFAVLVDDFHIAAVAVFGIGGRMLPSSLVEDWTWVDKDRKGQVLELQRMMCQPWAPKGMVSWFLRRCRMVIRGYYPELRAIVVYVAPDSRDRWTGKRLGHTGTTYARYCRGRRLPNSRPRTEYRVNGVWVEGRQYSKIGNDEHTHNAGGTLVTDLNPDQIERRVTGSKRRFIWFENCDPRHVIQHMKKPLIDFQKDEDLEVISFDHIPSDWEIDG